MTTGGVASVQSIYSTATVAATSTNPASVTYMDLVALFSGLEEAYQDQASFVMSSTTRNLLFGVTDDVGRPLFQPAPADGGIDRLFGKPIIIINYAPSLAAGNRAILYGAMDAGYLLRVPNSLAIFRATERFIDTAEIGLIGFAEIGGVALHAGDNPILALQQHS